MIFILELLNQHSKLDFETLVDAKH